MKIQFIDEYEELISTFDADEVPSTFDSILLFDVMYYVQSVTWDIANKVVLVSISEKSKTKDKVPSIFAVGATNESSGIRAIDKKLTETIKDAASLRRQVFSLKQHVDKIKTDIKKE